MTWRRWYSVFSRAPLTYETLQERCTHFHTQKSHLHSQLKDYIIANRKLQAINRRLDPLLKYGTLGVNLDLRLKVSSAQLERELWQFMQKYWTQCVSSETVVKTYVSTSTGGNVSHLFQLVRENFNYNLINNKRPSLGPVTTLIQVLLRDNDFHGCFKLVDDTVNSRKFLAFRKRQFLNGLWKYGFVSVCVSTFFTVSYVLIPGYGMFTLPIIANSILTLWPIFPWSLASGIGLFLSFKWLKTASLPRILWRPYTSIFHRWLHSEEALLVNKLVTYFEEYAEINVKNFHISEVRHRTQLSVFDTNDYELYLPESLDHVPLNVKDTLSEALTRYFRSELHQRKMVWNPLKEEKMFVDFWVNHGDSYEWVEPDQDPAEMAILKPQNISEKVENEISGY